MMSLPGMSTKPVVEMAAEVEDTTPKVAELAGDTVILDERVEGTEVVGAQEIGADSVTETAVMDEAATLVELADDIAMEAELVDVTVVDAIVRQEEQVDEREEVDATMMQAELGDAVAREGTRRVLMPVEPITRERLSLANHN